MKESEIDAIERRAAHYLLDGAKDQGEAMVLINRDLPSLIREIRRCHEGWSHVLEGVTYMMQHE